MQMWVLLLCALASAQLCDDECSKVLATVNYQRKLTGAGPLCVNTNLMQAAMVQARYQNSINTMTHTGAGGTNVGDRLTTTGYKWSQAAENVAMGQTTPKSVMLAWMNSEGHRKNILNPESTETGLAHVGEFWAQTFAKPRGGSGGCNAGVVGGQAGILEGDSPDVGPPCDAMCQSVLQVVNSKRASKGYPPLCINAKLQTAAAALALAGNLNNLQTTVDNTGFGSKGVGAAEHSIHLSRGLPTDSNILDMLNKDYQGSGNGQTFNRGGIGHDATREFWVIIEAATYTPDKDKCMDASSTSNSVSLRASVSFPATTASSFAAPAPSFAASVPSFAASVPSLSTIPSFAATAALTQTLGATTGSTTPTSGVAAAIWPPAATDCSKFTTPCQCTGRCGWSTANRGCVLATVSTFTDCSECPSQAKCTISSGGHS